MHGRLTIHAIDTPCSLSSPGYFRTCTGHLSFVVANNREHLSLASYRMADDASGYCDIFLPVSSYHYRASPFFTRENIIDGLVETIYWHDGAVPVQ